MLEFFPKLVPALLVPTNDLSWKLVSVLWRKSWRVRRRGIIKTPGVVPENKRKAMKTRGARVHILVSSSYDVYISS